MVTVGIGGGGGPGGDGGGGGGGRLQAPTFEACRKQYLTILRVTLWYRPYRLNLAFPHVYNNLYLVIMDW